MSRRIGVAVAAAYGVLISMALVLPVAAVVASSFTAGESVAFPPQGFSLRWYGEFVQSSDFVASFQVSLQVAVIATVVSLGVALPASVWISRSTSRFAVAVELFLLSPLMLATIVLGMAILQIYILLRIPASPVAIALGHAVIGVPYVARFAIAGLAGVSTNCERAARTLGAPPLRAFFRVTMPMMRHGVVAGALFCFLVSLDDVNIALFLSDVETTTLPVRTFSHIEQNADPLGAAVGSVLVFVALVFLLVSDRIVGVDRMFGLQRSTS